MTLNLCIYSVAKSSVFLCSENAISHIHQLDTLNFNFIGGKPTRNVICRVL